jgi:hypothetical protein
MDGLVHPADSALDEMMVTGHEEKFDPASVRVKPISDTPARKLG